MADLYTEIDALVAAKLREQSGAHADIAMALALRAGGNAGTALCRARVHAETARRYQILADAVDDGLLNRLAAGDHIAELVMAG